MSTKKIYIKGMHCTSCEKLLEDEFGSVAGVKKVRVNYKKKSGEIEFEKEVNFSQLVGIAEKLGYKIYENEVHSKSDDVAKRNFTTSLGDWLKAILIVGILLMLFKVFQNTGIIEGINFQDKSVGLGVALLVGVVASLSSCLVIVGSVVIAFAEKYKSSGDGFYQKAVKPNLFFHIGRVSTFFILGGLLGLIGGQINVGGQFISIFMVIIAIVMGWLGLSLLIKIPSLSQVGVVMPKFLTKKWDVLKKSDHKSAPFLVGGLSFFLPCGFTQSMQIIALTSGSFWTGGLTMLAFSLGTLPVLMAAGVATSWMKSKKVVVFQKAAGILIVLFALLTLQSGLALNGIDASFTNMKTTGKTDKNSEVNVTDESTKKQIVEMRVTNSGFSPATIVIRKDVPVEWVIYGDSITGCTNKIIVPSLNISQGLISGKNVVTFTPTKTGTIPFSCWMGMVKGKFVVE